MPDLGTILTNCIGLLGRCRGVVLDPTTSGSTSTVGLGVRRNPVMIHGGLWMDLQIHLSRILYSTHPRRRLYAHD
jgi:hypothetical protein